jgi:hypothetical protein
MGQMIITPRPWPSAPTARRSGVLLPRFAPRDINAVYRVARYAAIAVHARRHADERRRADRPGVVARVARLITGDLNPDDPPTARPGPSRAAWLRERRYRPPAADAPETLVAEPAGRKDLIQGAPRIPFTRGLMELPLVAARSCS